MVNDEIQREESPIMAELNQYFIMAQEAYANKEFDRSKQLYRDIVKAGEMMLAEAAEHIRERIKLEENLQDLMREADKLMANEQYDKAKKILEKILDEAQ